MRQESLVIQAYVHDGQQTLNLSRRHSLAFFIVGMGLLRLDLDVLVGLLRDDTVVAQPRQELRHAPDVEVDRLDGESFPVRDSCS